jgi:hypothetical protein
MLSVAIRQNVVFYCTVTSVAWGFGERSLRGVANGDRWPIQLSLEKQVCPSKMTTAVDSQWQAKFEKD